MIYITFIIYHFLALLQIEMLNQTTLAQAMKEILLINPAMKWVLDKAVEAASESPNHVTESEDIETNPPSAQPQRPGILERPSIEPYPSMKSVGNPSAPPFPSLQAPKWCYCGRCQEMPLPEEQVCCRSRRWPGPCITETASNAFRFYIVERGILRLFVLARNDWFAMDDNPAAMDTLRHTAYRLFVLWKHGHLGAGRRVVISSCVVCKIRRSFPSPDGNYTGFKVSRFN